MKKICDFLPIITDSQDKKHRKIARGDRGYFFRERVGKSVPADEKIRFWRETRYVTPAAANLEIEQKHQPPTETRFAISYLNIPRETGYKGIHIQAPW